jgi:hypothetical protein
MVHRADVMKDRTWELNGKVCAGPTRTGYKPGDYCAGLEIACRTSDVAQLIGGGTSTPSPAPTTSSTTTAI